MNKKQVKNNKGITLLTLSVTIIVLLILAGITIGTVLDDNGIISKAQESKNKLGDMVNSDNEQLNSLLDEYNNIMDTSYINIQETHTTTSITLTVDTNKENITEYEFFINGQSYGKQKDKTFTTNIELANKEPYIPSGFEHTEGTVDTGYVIKDVSIGNEFVWIPVKSGIFTVYVTATDENGNVIKSSEKTIGISELTREVKGRNIVYTDWEEDDENINDKTSIAYFKDSAIKNSGFYMGRYEMGMPGQKSGDEPILDTNINERDIKGTPVCVADVMPWTYISWNTAKENLESMYTGEVQSAMLNSYARTTTLNWIIDTGAKTLDELLDSSSYGNYSAANNGKDYSFKGYYYVYSGYEIQNEGKATDYESILNLSDGFLFNVLINTGANTQQNKRNQINNIYDLAGNTFEWSTEKRKSEIGYRKSGGSFTSGSSAYPAIDNNKGIIQYGTMGDYETSSRPILYK